MTAMLWLPLVAKAVATALIVVSASVAAEALGPGWGAIVASLPVSAGPAYVFLAMQHGPDFVAASALNSAAANAATGLFLMTYGILAKHMPPWRSLGTSVAIWLAVMQQTVWTLATAAALNFAVYRLSSRPYLCEQGCETRIQAGAATTAPMVRPASPRSLGRGIRLARGRSQRGSRSCHDRDGGRIPG